jgi:neutral ceramidase
MGYAFAAGTTDGPGMFNFEQGTTTGNFFWNKVRNFLNKPTKEEQKCQHPKPILLNTGDMEKPYAWDPSTIPLQILRIGQLFIVCVPSELTTMSGRRVRATIKNIIQPLLEEGQDAYIAISGLTNTYSSYVATYEEYQAQRYEAASTIYGPHTLQAYQQELSRLATDMVKNVESETSERPENMYNKQVEMALPVILDRHPHHKKFGDVLKDAEKTYKYGDIVSVEFQGANPRNNQKIQESFLTVELKDDRNNDKYLGVCTVGDWSTQFHWKRHLGGESTVKLQWTIGDGEQEVKQGKYRICYHGDHQSIIDKIVPFHGCSSDFTVVQNAN